MSIYALNLFDLADNDDYLGYSRRSAEAVGSYGGRVIALGHHGADIEPGETTAREAIVLVEWPSYEALQAYQDDPALADLHPLRRDGTQRYLWWSFDKLEDLRPLLKHR